MGNATTSVSVETPPVGTEFIPSSFATSVTNSVDVDIDVPSQIRYESSETFTSNNTILLEGELGFDTSNRRLKIGDGITGWNNLDYIDNVAEERIQRLERSTLWDPRRIKTNIWIDSFFTKNFILNGANVSSWLDLSGEGNHLTSSNPYGSLYVENHVEFPNSFGYLDNQSPSNTIHATGQHLCVFVVQDIDDGVILQNDATDASHQPKIKIDNGTIYHEVGSGISSTSIDSEPNVIACLQTSESTSIFVNGIREDIQLNLLSGSLVSDFVRVGEGNFRLSELVFLAYPTCTGDRQTLEGYLAHKWGLQDKLATDHPYKLGAPLVVANDITCGYGYGL